MYFRFTLIIYENRNSIFIIPYIFDYASIIFKYLKQKFEEGILKVIKST